MVSRTKRGRIAFLAIALQAAGCTSWAAANTGVAETVSASPSAIRILKLDGVRVEVRNPQLVADSIRGGVRECYRRGVGLDERATCTTVVTTVAGLSDVVDVEVPRFSLAKTAMGVLILPAFALVSTCFFAADYCW